MVVPVSFSGIGHLVEEKVVVQVDSRESWKLVPVQQTRFHDGPYLFEITPLTSQPPPTGVPPEAATNIDRFCQTFSQSISFASCQLSTDWEHTFHICLRCRSWQQVGKWSQQWVFIGIHDSELKSTVFWVVLAVSKISNQFSSVYTVTAASEECSIMSCSKSQKHFNAGWLTEEMYILWTGYS